MTRIQRTRACPGRSAAPASRRDFLKQSALGLGWLAFKVLCATEAGAAPHHAAKAKSIIFCFMDGGPSHVDTFDYKPMLTKHQGKAIGAGAVSKRSQSAANRVWLGSPWTFRQRGKSGLWVSDLLPNLANVADELCVVRSLVGELPLHGQSNLLLHTGRILGQAPSFGSWVSYGLGSANRNLPGYVVLNNDWVPNGGLENFGSSFLPASHQATMMRARGAPMDNITTRDSAAVQRRKLALLAEQDTAFAKVASDSRAIDGAVANYETAFRMQTEVPQLADVRREPAAIQRLYGLDSKDEHQRYYATQALRARRLVEAGARFVEITCPSFDGNNSPWDQHGMLKVHHEKNARVTDQSVAALIRDLKQRGLLDQTIVLWAGEMGRTPHTPAIHANCGRDHHVNGFTMCMAGGGLKKGVAYGETDEFGNAAVVSPLTVHDIHATLLHLLGLDHTRLTYRHGGRDHRLTDVHGNVIKEVIG